MQMIVLTTLSHNGPDVMPWDGKVHARRGLEAVVAQHFSDEVVGQHLGSERAEGDR